MCVSLVPEINQVMGIGLDSPFNVNVIIVLGSGGHPNIMHSNMTYDLELQPLPNASNVTILMNFWNNMERCQSLVH